MATFDELRAKDLTALFGIDLGAALGHLAGRIQATVPTETWTVLTFEDRTDAEAVHAVLTARRIFALRTQETAGWRLWIRWAEEPEPVLVRSFFQRLLGGLRFRIASEGQTLAPLHGGGSTVGPDGRPASFAGVPKNSLAPLARRLRGSEV